MLADGVMTESLATGFSALSCSVGDYLLTLFQSLKEWLLTTRTDSGIWAIAFTVNTWASSVNRVRTNVYLDVRRKIKECKNKVINAQWLESVGKSQSAEMHEDFRASLSELLNYMKDVESRVSIKTVGKKVFAKNIMGVSAFVCALCMIFQWYYNFTIVLLFPYPIFWIKLNLVGTLASHKIKRLYNRADEEYRKFKENDNTKNKKSVPSVKELQTMLAETPLS